MLEQNTKLLFKKELDSLSKGVFTRNQKHRKSVHFPYHEKQGGNNNNSSSNNNSGNHHNHHTAVNSRNNAKNPAPVTSAVILPNGKGGSPGFYTLSKAKSLSHLFGGERPSGGGPVVADQAPATMVSSMTQTGPMGNNGNMYGKSIKAHFPLFSNSNSAFLGSVRSPPTRATILGGPNAAYFGSAQRLISPAPPSSQASPKFYDPDEIQEIRNYESIEHDSRLKKYWDNKVTEL